MIDLCIQWFLLYQRLRGWAIQIMVLGLSQMLWRMIQNIRGNLLRLRLWSVLHRLRWGTLGNIQWLERDIYRRDYELSDQERLSG